MRGAVFRRFDPRTHEYLTLPFRCGSWSCPGCAADRARAVRAGIRRAVDVHGLRDLLTLTLYRDVDLSPVESRTKISRLWNALATRLRRTAICAASSCRRVWSMGRGRDNCPSCGSPIFVRFLTEYVAVDEEHQDGTAHRHIAANIDGLLMAERNDYGAVRARLSEAWGRLGGGFVDFSAGRAAANAAGYLTKYIAKSQLKAPRWATSKWCTEDGSFRTRPWHRFSSSRLAGRTIAGPRSEPDSALFPWSLCREEPRPNGRMTYALWNPAEGSAIVGCSCGRPHEDGEICTTECGGHPPVPEWKPGDCHHGGGPIANLGQCLCIPPWASEPSWTPLVQERNRDLREVLAMTDEELDAEWLEDLERTWRRENEPDPTYLSRWGVVAG